MCYQRLNYLSSLFTENDFTKLCHIKGWMKDYGKKCRGKSSIEVCKWLIINYYSGYYDFVVFDMLSIIWDALIFFFILDKDLCSCLILYNNFVFFSLKRVPQVINFVCHKTQGNSDLPLFLCVCHLVPPNPFPNKWSEHPQKREQNLCVLPAAVHSISGALFSFSPACLL